MKKAVVFFILLISLATCEKKQQQADYNKGEISLYTDGAFYDVATALSEAYTMNYPDAKIMVTQTREDSVFLQFSERKIPIALFSDTLSEDKRKYLKQKLGIDYHPDYFAADALLFIVPKTDARESLSYSEIKNMLTGTEKIFVLDGVNSSNINFLQKHYKLKFSDLKFDVIRGNRNLAENLKNYPGRIGVISQNTLSRLNDPDTKALYESVKILPVEKNGEKIQPVPDAINTLKYPFTRLLYFLDSEPGYGMAKGFIRFSCTQKGQLVVKKEGLEPYNKFPRTVRFRQE